MNPLIQYIVLPGLLLVVMGFILAVVIMVINKVFNIQPRPIVSAVIAVAILFISVKAFSAPVVCISDEAKEYRFEVEAYPYIQIDEWISGPKKGLKTLFFLAGNNSIMQYRCEGCAVKFKRTHSLSCKQEVI